MKRLWDIYRAYFSIKMAEQLQYRAALAIWLIEIALTPTIAIVVWSTLANGQGGSLAGYTPANFAGYFIATMIVNYITQTWVFWEFEGRIQQGQLSSFLLRPTHPIHADIAQNVAYKLLMSLIIIPLTILLILLFHPVFVITWVSGVAMIFALLLAFLLRLIFEWAFALLAFWTTVVAVLNTLYTLILLFLSGQFMPLNLFPAFVQAIANFLPFRWMIAFPVELCVSSPSTSEVWIGLGMQSFWLVVSIGLLNFLWRKGIRRYSAVGA